jgi:hypothetical protein
VKILLFLATLSLNASTVYIGSSALTTTNDSGHETVDLLHPAPLSGSVWIWDGADREATFTLQITGGELQVLTKGATSVVLNGHTLIAGTKQDTFTFAQLEPYLVDGNNILSFDVWRGHWLDFAGTVDTQATPEPATMALIGCGLLTLAGLRRRK